MEAARERAHSAAPAKSRLLKAVPAADLVVRQAYRCAARVGAAVPRGRRGTANLGLCTLCRAGRGQLLRGRSLISRVGTRARAPAANLTATAGAASSPSSTRSISAVGADARVPVEHGARVTAARATFEASHALERQVDEGRHRRSLVKRSAAPCHGVRATFHSCHRTGDGVGDVPQSTTPLLVSSEVRCVRRPRGLNSVARTVPQQQRHRRLRPAALACPPRATTAPLAASS